MELGEGQADKVKELIDEDGHFGDTETVKDLQGIGRTIIARSS